MTETPKKEEANVKRGGAPIRSMLLGASKGITVKVIVQGGLFASAWFIPAVGTLLESGSYTLAESLLFGFNFIFLILNLAFGYLGVLFGLSKEGRRFRRVYGLVVGLFMVIIGTLLELAVALLVSSRFDAEHWFRILLLQNCGCLVGAALPVIAVEKLPPENCLECGSKNPDISKFCWKCGAPLYAPKKPEKEKHTLFARARSASFHVIRMVGGILIFISAPFLLFISWLFFGSIFLGYTMDLFLIILFLGPSLGMMILGVGLLIWTKRRILGQSTQ